MVIGSEKWIPASGILRRNETRCNENELPQQTAKPGLHSRKVLLSVWRDYREILYRELHLSNETANSNEHVAQLEGIEEGKASTEIGDIIIEVRKR